MPASTRRDWPADWPVADQQLDLITEQFHPASRLAPPAPPAPLIPPNRISGTGEGERHFVGDPGFSTPANLAALQTLGALGVISAWTGDTFVTLGDGSTAWWNGTAWAAGKPAA